MKFINTTIILIALSLSSCSSLINRNPASETELIIEPKLQREIEEFQNLVEEVLVWRTKAVEFAEKNAAKLAKEQLSHSDMLLIFNSAREYFLLRNRVMDMALKYQAVVTNGADVKYVPSEPTSIKKGKRVVAISDNAKTSISSKVNSSIENYDIIRINPLDQIGFELLLKTKISLNAALLLYDSYMIGLYPYYSKKKIRRLINRDMPGAKNQFDKVTDSFFDEENRSKLEASINLVQEDFKFKKTQDIKISAEEDYLNFLIQSSTYYLYVTDGGNEIKTPSRREVYLSRFRDRIRFLNNFVTFGASKIFGNAVGVIAFRKGKMTHLDIEARNSIKAELRPLDILLEKTPFRLTDRFIPGYYGHVAIWVGTEEELKELNIWDHPIISKYHQQIRSGHHIIEALRPGVEINSLEHFLNIDDLLVLRDQSLDTDSKREYIIRAFEQIGKEYDFNFDVETDKRIVCSEIVYVVFHNINWPTTKALGRYTISPDHVVEKVFNNNVLTPVLMYQNGKKVEENLYERLEILVQEPKKQPTPKANTPLTE